MPELPEVETIRRDLSAALVGSRFSSVNVLFAKTALPSAVFLEHNLVGRRIIDINRRGKLLIFCLDDLKGAHNFNEEGGEEAFKYLLIHLKMTGQLIYQGKGSVIAGGHSLNKSEVIPNSLEMAVGGCLPNKYTRAIFSFDNGANLFFNDLRKFGYLKICSRLELDRLIADNYGLEPLTPQFTADAFYDILKKKQTTIKAVLLNQKFIAGLGNIYVDEALFAANILPTRLASSLTKSEVKNLWRAIQKIIELAIINRGTTFSDYRDSEGRKGNYSQYLQVYGRKDQKCFVCGNKLQKMKLVGRGTHYCAYCQK